jgi:hypothetical protein
MGTVLTSNTILNFSCAPGFPGPGSLYTFKFFIQLIYTPSKLLPNVRAINNFRGIERVKRKHDKAVSIIALVQKRNVQIRAKTMICAVSQ